MTAPLRHSPHPDGSSTRVDEATAAVRRDEFLARAAMLPGAWVGCEPEWDIPVTSVGSRLPLLLIPHTDGRFLVNVRLGPEDVVAVRATSEWVEPDSHQPKRYWASIDLTSPDYQANEIIAMVENSYRLVLPPLIRCVRGAILLADTAGFPARPTWQ